MPLPVVGKMISLIAAISEESTATRSTGGHSAPPFVICSAVMRTSIHARPHNSACRFTISARELNAQAEAMRQLIEAGLKRRPKV
jgi:hypothetical protein